MSRLPTCPPMPRQTGPGEGFPEDLPALNALMAGLVQEENLWNAYIRDLSALEDPKNGVFHAQDLHQARQCRMAVKCRKDFCRARLARLNGHV